LAKVASLPSVVATTLGKEALSVPRCTFFAECSTKSIFAKCNTPLSDQISPSLFVFPIPSKLSGTIIRGTQITL
jgi:hypothetical protein